MRNEELGIRNGELGMKNEKYLNFTPHFSFLIPHSSRVLVAPLNWGLGHATRCVPIIRGLLAEDHEVVIAADGYPLRFLRREFPHLEWVEFEGLKVKYSDSASQVGAMLRQLPSFLRGEVNGVKVDNTTEEEVAAWIEALKVIQPKEVMLYSLDRKTPYDTLYKVEGDELQVIADRVEALGIKTQVTK